MAQPRLLPLAVVLLLLLSVPATAQQMQVPHATCSLEIEGWGGRQSGIRKASLACSGDTVLAAADPLLRPFVQGAKGVTWGRDHCGNEAWNCLFRVCLGTNVHFKNLRIVGLRAPEMQATVCLEGLTSVIFTNATFTNNQGSFIGAACCLHSKYCAVKQCCSSNSPSTHVYLSWNHAPVCALKYNNSALSYRRMALPVTLLPQDQPLGTCSCSTAPWPTIWELMNGTWLALVCCARRMSWCRTAYSPTTALLSAAAQCAWQMGRFALSTASSGATLLHVMAVREGLLPPSTVLQVSSCCARAADGRVAVRGLARPHEASRNNPARFGLLHHGQ